MLGDDYDVTVINDGCGPANWHSRLVDHTSSLCFARAKSGMSVCSNICLSLGGSVGLFVACYNFLHCNDNLFL